LYHPGKGRKGGAPSKVGGEKGIGEESEKRDHPPNRGFGIPKNRNGPPVGSGKKQDIQSDNELEWIKRKTAKETLGPTLMGPRGRETIPRYSDGCGNA